MLNMILGIGNFFDLLADPSFWIMVIGAIGLVFVIIACIKHPTGGKYVLLTIFSVAMLGVTAYSGIQLNYYYSASGGIYGAISGIFDTNEVEKISKASYLIKNTELTQVYETDTYSATISFSDVFELSKDSKYMIYVNDMPCNNVHSASDYITGEYTYTFYNEFMQELHTDTLTIRFAFYSNSTYLSISTNGGAESVKYWNYYFTKNSFIISLDKATYSKPTQIGNGNGDISNYCIVSYLVDGKNVGNQVYLPNTPLTLIDYAGKTYGWKYDNELISDGYLITENMTISAQSLPLHTITFMVDDEEYLTQQVFDGDNIDTSLVTIPETRFNGNGEYSVFDFWSIDGVTEYDITRYPMQSDLVINAVMHKEFDVDFIVNGEIYQSQIVRQGYSVNSVKNPPTTYNSVTGYSIFDYWSLDGINELDIEKYPINSYTKLIAVFHSDFNVTFMFNDEIYLTQKVTDGSYISEIENPTETNIGNNTFVVFDYWSLDGVNEIDIYNYKLRENTTIYAVTHYEYDITFWFLAQDFGSMTGTITRCRVGDYLEFKTEENFVVDYYALGGRDGERLTGNGTIIKGAGDIYAVGDYIYNVVFKIDETNYTTIQVLKGHYAEFSTIPTKDGCEFLGWSLDGNNVVELSGTIILEDTTFTAVFEDVTQQLHLDYNDGSESEIWVMTGKYGETISLPIPTSLTGETFVKWCFGGGYGELDDVNNTFTFGKGLGIVYALYEECDVYINCSKLGFYLTYNGETTQYGSSSSSGGSDGGVTPLAFVDLGCTARITTTYNATLILQGTGLNFWVEQVDCDGEYQIIDVTKTTATIVFTNCNYVNIKVGGNNISYT